MGVGMGVRVVVGGGGRGGDGGWRRALWALQFGVGGSACSVGFAILTGGWGWTLSLGVWLGDEGKSEGCGGGCSLGSGVGVGFVLVVGDMVWGCGWGCRCGRSLGLGVEHCGGCSLGWGLYSMIVGACNCG